MTPFALTSHGLDEVIFHVANVLEVPVLIAALLALALVLYECGAFAVELHRRRRRSLGSLSTQVLGVRRAVIDGDLPGAELAAAPIARSAAMAQTIGAIISGARAEHGEHRVNKALAEFDFDAQRRLGRTRMLVRAGPALGLMGTLIPLSPALTGLARGDTTTLSDNLRVAFSVTVLGLLIGAIAFAVSLTRDRLYGEDLSDLQYLAAVLCDPPLTRAGR